MKITLASITLIFVSAMVVVCPVNAGVPDFVTYSGRLSDGTAWGQSTLLDLTFRVYAQAEGGEALWEHEITEVAIEDGYFSVVLGAGINPATGDDFNVNLAFTNHPETWITLCVGPDCLPADDLLPRQRVGSVPYSIHSEYSDNTGMVEGQNLDSLDGRYVNADGDSVSGDLEIQGDLSIQGSVSTGSALCVFQKSPCNGSHPHEGGKLRFRAGPKYADHGAYFRVVANGEEYGQYGSAAKAALVHGPGGIGCSGTYCGGDFTIYLCCR